MVCHVSTPSSSCAMRVAYPASDQLSQLNDTQRALKIARHSPCSLCSPASCSSLRPLPGVEVVLDQHITNDSSLGDLGQYGSDVDEDDSDIPYLETCACGHDIPLHRPDSSEVDHAEFARWARIAIRLDEQLHNIGRLLDFDYVDDEILSGRQQMRNPVSLVSPVMRTTLSPEVPLSPASSDLSELSQPPNKKRRTSTSSPSNVDDDDEDEDEDKPLAARVAVKSARSEKTPRSSVHKRSGKTTGKAKKSHTAPVSLPSPVEGEQSLINGTTNGVNGYNISKIKVEDVMDEGQLTRLAAGVTVDTATRASAAPPIKTEKAAIIELRKGVIQVTPVRNDQQPRSIIILTGLKTLFQKQLPNMPREYIARLVLDANSRGLAIIKRGFKVVGGICFRPFPHRGFAEIVFFATASADQEKGYGGMLMDHFKAHIKKTYPGMMYFLTYADNYAVGYFEKQGFSKDITLDRSVWAAYIKDYEGGTIMQCTMLQKIDYLDKPNTFAQQQEAVMSKIRQMSKSHIVYPGLPQFQPGAPEGITVDPKDVPGLREECYTVVSLVRSISSTGESGWSLEASALNPIRSLPKNADAYFLERLLKELQGHPQAWAFLVPVKTEEVPDYLDVIKHPMDFTTMEHKLEANEYPTIESFLADAQLIFDNCRTYNPETSIWHRNAIKMEKFLKDYLQDQTKQES